MLPGGLLVMNTEQIQNALRDMEESFPTGQAQVRFDFYGGGVDESFIRGTRAGIVRLGICLIRAALQPEQRKSINGRAQLECDLTTVIHPESDVKFDWIELSDDLDHEPEVQLRTRRRLRKESFIGWVVVAVAVIIYLIWRFR
jgi:hypothetical protein